MFSKGFLAWIGCEEIETGLHISERTRFSPREPLPPRIKCGAGFGLKTV